MLKIPSSIEKYLWDVDAQDLTQAHSSFIIERILEYGDLEDLKWLEKNFKSDEIISTLKQSKKVSPKTGNFFALYFNIPRKELQCIRKPFTRKQDRF